ncbi:MAG TPA: ABC transporter substrate-binding protein [Castellaniella sp.]|uniref:ABC transporter substrate-binding protein n=1 Tax=Castellaniella sp. TaxID=1955812 RepID=UPI002F1DDE73
MDTQIRGFRSAKTWAVAGSLILGCFMAALAPASAYAQDSSNLTKIRFVVSHRSALLSTLPTYIAEDNGLFKKHGISVEYISGSGGGSTLRLLSTGDVDMAEGGTPAAILAAHTDPNIELVEGWARSASVMVWIASKSSGITSPEGLSGKKLGYSKAGSASQWLAEESIHRAGVKNVSFVSVGGMGDNWTAVKGGIITAGWAMEPFLSEKIHNDNAVVVLDPSHYIKHYYLEGIAVNKKFAQKNTAAVKGLFMALDEAVAFIKANPEKAAEIGTRHYKSSKAVLLSGIKTYLKNDVWDMKIDTAAFNTVMKGMKDSGLIDKEIDMSKLVHQNYLPEHLRTPF